MFGGHRGCDRMVVEFTTTYAITTLWVRILLMAKCTRYNIMWKSLSVTCDRSAVFFLDTWVSSTNKADCYDITEIFLKVVLNTIPITLNVWRHIRYSIIHVDCPNMRKAVNIYWPIGQHVSVCARVSVKHFDVLNINCYWPKKSMIT